MKRYILIAVCLSLAACAGEGGSKQKEELVMPAATAPGAPYVILPMEPHPVVQLHDADGPLWPWFLLGLGMIALTVAWRNGR